MKRTITQTERNVLSWLVTEVMDHGRQQTFLRERAQLLLGVTSAETPIVVWPSDPDRAEADTDRMLALYGITVEVA